jgi:hypothetical protein
MDSRINQVLFHIIDSEADWRCRMDKAVKSNFLCLENIIESARSSNVGDINEVNLPFPFRMNGEDGFCFGWRSDCCDGLVSFLL